MLDVVDNTKAENFIVFSTGRIDTKVDSYFEYATMKDVRHYIPDNSMRIRKQKSRMNLM